MTADGEHLSTEQAALSPPYRRSDGSFRDIVGDPDNWEVMPRSVLVAAFGAKPNAEQRSKRSIFVSRGAHN